MRVRRSPPPQASSLIGCGRSRSHFLPRPVSILGSGRFRYLNATRALRFPEGWLDPGASRLWTYNLHYFDGLNAPDTALSDKRDAVESWISSNGIGIGPGWEPYPTSLRIVNWIKWLSKEDESVSRVHESLAHQVRYLTQVLEYHLLGNHLLANAKALVFAGLAFEGNEADKWYRLGMDLLGEQVGEQFLADGAHFELSPVYHATLTEDLLDLIHLHQLRHREPPEYLAATGERALTWLVAMTRPDGLPPLFNDAAYGVAPSCHALLGYAEELGLARPSSVRPGMTILRDSGYVRFARTKYSIFWDVGEIGASYNPGHGHCDMLSFEAFVDGVPVVVDTGTSTYESGARRDYERGTEAHNTVQVGDLQQSEVWGGFRVARRARPTGLVKTGATSVRAGLRGFPPNEVEHSREFAFHECGLTIRDEIRHTPRGMLSVARFHFHPDEEPKLMDGTPYVRSKRVAMTFHGARSVHVTDYQYAPEFNRLVPGKVVEVWFSGRLGTGMRF